MSFLRRAHALIILSGLTALCAVACDNTSEPTHVASQPVDTALGGRYFLSSVNTFPIPAFDVIADTITLRSDSTYTTAGALGGSSAISGITGPDHYDLVLPDTLLLPVVIFGKAQGQFRFIRSGTTLTYTEHPCCGQPDLIWRFDKEGSHPALPAPPTLVASQTQAAFTAVSHGPNPAPISITISSSTAIRLTGLDWRGYSQGVNGFGMSDWILGPGFLSATPATFTLSIYNTALPPGQYTGVFQITANAPGNVTTSIGVTYTVTAQ